MIKIAVIARFEFEQFWSNKYVLALLIALQWTFAWGLNNLQQTYEKHLAVSFRQAFPLYDLYKEIWHPLMASSALAILVILPFLTAKILSSHPKDGKNAILILSKVSAWEILMGKFIASALVAQCFLLILPLNYVLTVFHGHTNWLAGLTAYYGLSGLILSYIAMGLVWQSSKITPWIAACMQLISFFILLGLEHIKSLSKYLPNLFYLKSALSSEFSLNSLFYYLIFTSLLLIIANINYQKFVATYEE